MKVWKYEIVLFSNLKSSASFLCLNSSCKLNNSLLSLSRLPMPYHMHLNEANCYYQSSARSVLSQIHYFIRYHPVFCVLTLDRFAKCFAVMKYGLPFSLPLMISSTHFKRLPGFLCHSFSPCQQAPLTSQASICRPFLKPTPHVLGCVTATPPSRQFLYQLSNNQK